MTRFLTTTGCLLVLLLAASLSFAQSEFSAEVFDTQKAEPQAKIYFGKDKIRFESGKHEQGGGAVIMDLTNQTSTVIMDQQHMYMEMPVQMAARRNPNRFFRIGDVDYACSDWLAQPWNKGGTCHKGGTETVNGRSTVNYEGTKAQGESGAFWLDPKLQFPEKWQGKNGGGELRNIQEGSQPSRLFEIPAGYTKFDMGAMMKQRPQ